MKQFIFSLIVLSASFASADIRIHLDSNNQLNTRFNAVLKTPLHEEKPVRVLAPEYKKKMWAIAGASGLTAGLITWQFSKKMIVPQPTPITREVGTWTFITFPLDMAAGCFTVLNNGFARMLPFAIGAGTALAAGMIYYYARSKSAEPAK